MKITDFSLIFIAIILPIIIVVYINVSYTIKAEEQEMYYEQLINSAIEDATTEMKQVENDDTNIDYGYSGQEDKKISVNAEIGIKTFFKSLYNNFGIKGNEAAERYLQLFVPVVAILDYNGVYVSSIEEYELNGQTVMEHAVKPKKYYEYTYYITDQKEDDGLFKIVSASLYKKEDGNITSSHTVEFTMDDYITHRGCTFRNSIPDKDFEERSFYIADTSVGSYVTGEFMDTLNNKDLYVGNSNAYDTQNVAMINKIAKYLLNIKSSVIIEIITNEIAYSVNANNFYAKSTGVTYNFVFPVIEQEQMGEYINDIGVLAFIQGLSIGNRYLETKAYSVTRLELVNRYYFSIPSKDSKYKMNLYHMSNLCPEYNLTSTTEITPSYVITKQQAASAIVSFKDSNGKDATAMGFYPCPICNP